MNGHILVHNKVDGEMQLWIYGELQARHIIPCSNRTVGPFGDDPYGYNGPCPPGSYHLDFPQPRDSTDGAYLMAEGRFFTPLLDFNHLWDAHGRAGIGCHGGGSASPHPLAPNQGFFPTEGCFRLLNADNENVFVPYVRAVLESGGTITFTVEEAV